MAEFYSAELAPTQASQRILADAVLIGGKVSSIKGTFTIPAGTAIGDTIVIGKLPPKARLLPLSTLHWEALGTGVRLEVGYKSYKDRYQNTIAEDTDAYLVSTAANATGNAQVGATVIFDHIIPDNEQVLVVKITGAVPTTNARFVANLYFASH